jgi:hypothetical protein
VLLDPVVLRQPALSPIKVFPPPDVVQRPADWPEKKLCVPVPPVPVHIPAPVETMFDVLQAANGLEPPPPPEPV